MKGTVGAEASVRRIVQKETLMKYTEAYYNGKRRRANYWHGLCSTNCVQNYLASRIFVGTKNTSYNYLF